MNQRFSAILIIALVVSAAATYGVYRVIAKRPTDTLTKTTQIVVAARTLETGAVIKDGDLKLGLWAGTVPPGMALKMDGLSGRGLLNPIYQGEAIMESRLAPVGGGGGLAATIPPGMRACAVRVNDIVGVAGFVVPGVRVDVVVAANSPGPGSGPRARTLLQNIQVLSAGQNYKTDAEGKPEVVPVVNLLVTPEQAEALSLINNGNEARIQLVLRNPLDKQEVTTPGTAMASLFGAPAAAPAAPEVPKVRVVRTPAKKIEPEKSAPPPPPPPPMLIQMINGAKLTESKFARVAEDKP